MRAPVPNVVLIDGVLLVLIVLIDGVSLDLNVVQIDGVSLVPNVVLIIICPNEPVTEAECVSAYAGFFTNVVQTM